MPDGITAPRRWIIAWTAIVAYVITLAVMAPATLLGNAVAEASSGRIRLIDAKGTLWSGSATLALANAGRAPLTRRTDWRLTPLGLLRGSIRWEIALHGASNRIPIELSPKGFRIGPADLMLQPDVLTAIVPSLAPLSLSGTFEIATDGIAFDRSEPHGTAAVLWRSAGSRHAGSDVLGNYRFLFTLKGRSIAMRAHTLDGPVMLTGDGTWTAGKFTGHPFSIAVPEKHRERLVPLLRTMAIERPDGTFELDPARMPG